MFNRILALFAVVVAVGSGAAWARQEPPKKAYLVAEIEVSNAQQYAEYMKLTPAVIEKFGGRFIVRGGRTVTLEGTPAKGRTVIVEFPNFEQAQTFYTSPEYEAAKKIRAGAATVRFTVVEGL